MKKLEKKTITTGCGQGTIFGSTLEKLYEDTLPEVKIKKSEIFNLLAKITKYNDIYKEAGAVHGCALCDKENVLEFVEDVGRHNAADTLSGFMWINDMSGSNIIFYTTLFCCLFSIIPMLIQGGNMIPSTSFEWINLLLLAVLCQFGGQYLITHGIGKISASEGSVGLLMQPITATILAAFIFGEILNITQIIFVLVALFGIYLARINLTGNQQKQT